MGITVSVLCCYADRKSINQSIFQHGMVFLSSRSVFRDGIPSIQSRSDSALALFSAPPPPRRGLVQHCLHIYVRNIPSFRGFVKQRILTIHYLRIRTVHVCFTQIKRERVTAVPIDSLLVKACFCCSNLIVHTGGVSGLAASIQNCLCS